MNVDQVRETSNRRQRNVEKTSDPSLEIPKIIVDPQILETAYRRMGGEKENRNSTAPQLSATPIPETNRFKDIRERALSLRMRKDEFKRQQEMLRIQAEKQIFQKNLRVAHESQRIYRQNDLTRLDEFQERQEKELKEAEDKVEDFIQHNQKQINACQDSMDLLFAKFTFKELEVTKACNQKLVKILESGEKNIEELLQEALCQHEEELKQALLMPANQTMNEPEKKIAALRERDDERKRALQQGIDAFRLEVEAVSRQRGEELNKFFIQSETDIEKVEARIEALSVQEKERAHMRKKQMNAFIQELEEIQEVNVEQNRQKIEKLRKDLHEGIQDNMQRLEKIDEDDRNTYHLHQHQIEQLNTQAITAERMVEELKQQKLKIAEKIAETKEANAKLTIAIKETKKAIKKRNNDQLGNVIKVVALVTISCCATWGLQQLLAQALPNATPIVSAIKDGAEITLKFTG